MAAVMSRVITLPPLLQIACLSHRYFMYHRVLAEDSKEKERGNAPPVEIVNMFSSSRLKAYAEKAKKRFDDICNICAIGWSKKVAQLLLGHSYKTARKNSTKLLSTFFQHVLNHFANFQNKWTKNVDSRQLL